MAAHRDVRPHRRVCAGSLTVSLAVGLPCAPVLYACGNRARRQHGQQGCSSTSRTSSTRRRAIRTVPVGGSRSGYGLRNRVGPMSADLPDVQGEGGQASDKREAGLLPSTSYHLPAAQHPVAPRPGGPRLAQDHAIVPSEEGWPARLWRAPKAVVGVTQSGVQVTILATAC